MNVTMTLTGDWPKFKDRLDARKFNVRLNRNMRRATMRNGQQFARAVRHRIKAKRYVKNAAMTIALKGYDAPFIEHAAGLYQAITSKMVSPRAALAGVYRTSPPAQGSDKTPYNIGMILHDGATIHVTAAMRGLFSILAAYSRGEVDPAKLTGRAAVLAEKLGHGVFHALRVTTTELHIPPRPFIRDVAEDRNVIEGCRKVWQDAYTAALHGVNL